MNKFWQKKSLCVLTILFLVFFLLGCSSDGDEAEPEKNNLRVSVELEELEAEGIESITDKIELDRAEATLTNQADSNDYHRRNKKIKSDAIAFDFKDLTDGANYDLNVKIYEEDSNSEQKFKVYQGSREVVIDSLDITVDLKASLTDAESVVFNLDNLPEDTASGFIKLLPERDDYKKDITLDGKAIFDNLAANYYDFKVVLKDEAGDIIYEQVYVDKLYAYPGQRTTTVEVGLADDPTDPVSIDIDWQTTPDAPEGLAPRNNEEGVLLSWDDSADYYFVYRGKSADDYKLVQNDLISENKYQDTNVKTGETYYYRIRAYDDNYLASGISEARSITVGQAEKPEINVTPGEGEHPGDTEVSIEIINADQSSIKFNETEIADNSFVLSDYLDEGDTGTLEITASNEEGIEEEDLDYIYKEDDDSDGVEIYYKYKSDGRPNIWVWENDGIRIAEEMGYDWDDDHPEMEETENDDWYLFEIPDEYLTGEPLEFHFEIDNSQVIERGSNESGWYDGENWYENNPRLLPPSINVTPAGGEVMGITNVEVDVSGYEISEVSIEFNGEEISTDEEYRFLIKDYLAEGEDGTLEISARNNNGSSEKEIEFSRNDDIEVDFTWDNATVYFAITDRFKDGNPDNNNAYGRPQEDASGENAGTFHGGDLAGLTEKLNDDYFKDLGVNAIWISAPYEQIHGWVPGGCDGDFAHYAYHGYYALDYTMMDQSFGTVEEMREFVDTAHDQDIRVIIDIVMNHPGYHTIVDMDKFGFGELDGIDGDWTPDDDNWNVDDDVYGGDEDDWKNWWGSDWVEARISDDRRMPGYDDLSDDLFGLPKFKTHPENNTDPVDIPPLLENKWARNKDEGEFEDYGIDAAEDLREDLDVAPAEYITKWLAAWVEEFGIDGFRVDTAPHVEVERWADLQKEANQALEKWRDANPNRPSSDWDDEFWMTAEDFDHGVEPETDYFDNGFASVINFAFQPQNGGGPAENHPSEMEGTYSHYADVINSDPNVNFLSYISQHDYEELYDRQNLINGGTNLLLVPGGAQIFYGDEIARQPKRIDHLSDSTKNTRSSMDWDDKNDEVLAHWQKVGQFRNRNIAVGAGDHEMISANPYTFSRVYQEDGFVNQVVVAITDETTEIEVGDVFIDGTKVRNAYNGVEETVEDGTVTFTGENGVILIEVAN